MQAVLVLPFREDRRQESDNIFAEHANSRIIIATFASNVDRVQQIINSAHKFGRKVVVEGRSMVNIISTAIELGYINIPDNTLISIDEIRNYPDEKTVLITTGSQGESMAALSPYGQWNASQGTDQTDRYHHLLQPCNSWQ